MRVQDQLPGRHPQGSMIEVLKTDVTVHLIFLLFNQC